MLSSRSGTLRWRDAPRNINSKFGAGLGLCWRYHYER